MKVLHVTPTYFDDRSYIGGGERFPYELARAMSSKTEVTFLSFSDHASSSKEGNLNIEYIPRSFLFNKHPLFGNPLSFKLLNKIRWADVVHCYQVHTIVTDLAIVLSSIFRKKIFVTDLGGGHKYAPSAYFPILKRTDGILLISQYSRMLWEQLNSDIPNQIEVIYGGVDLEKFSPGAEKKKDQVLFVGRILPHKGIDYLIDAVNNHLGLNVVGRVYNEQYFNLLKEKSKNKNVQFETDIGDAELVNKYRTAQVTVVPSVYTNYYGHTTNIPELLGLVVLESMACGTPVIVTDVASLPELVENGVTGFIVPPNNPKAIQEKLDYLKTNPDEAIQMGIRGRQNVEQKFTWAAVVERCLKAYSSSN
jgi:glycosyltransferase involved in cell wall biosynthesis